MSSSAGVTSYGLCFRATPDFPARRRWEWSEPSSPEPVSFVPGPPHPAAADTAVDTIDYSDSLPDEVLLLVLSRLRSRVDRNAAAAVCKRWLQVEAGLRTALHLSVTECSPSRTPKPERGCMDRVLLYMLRRLTNLREIQLVNLIVPGESTFTVSWRPHYKGSGQYLGSNLAGNASVRRWTRTECIGLPNFFVHVHQD